MSYDAWLEAPYQRMYAEQEKWEALNEEAERRNQKAFDDGLRPDIDFTPWTADDVLEEYEEYEDDAKIARAEYERDFRDDDGYFDRY